jgi:hypothetical protein
MTLKILVATHQDKIVFSNEYLCPIQVGKNISNIDLSMIGDNIGVNISDRNINYCELTAIFCLWKNFKNDYVGLMHYRRYLILDNMKTPSKFYELFMKTAAGFGKNIIFQKLFLNFYKKKYVNVSGYLNMDSYELLRYIDNSYLKIEELLNEKNIDVILPKKTFTINTPYEIYKAIHLIEHLDKTIQIIKERFPEISLFVEEGLHKNYAYYGNIFIMKWKYFDKYCTFLFDVLFELEKQIIIPTDNYQKRVFGFISERLMAPFIDYLIATNKITVYETDLAFINFKKPAVPIIINSNKES